MKYHKIRNIPLEVCTAEQKIAYNLAFSLAGLYKNEYNSAPMQFQKDEVIRKAINFCIEIWKENPKHSAKKYDIDSIFCCLNAGFENYIKNNCPIYANYEEVGKAFPALYL